MAPRRVPLASLPLSLYPAGPSPASSVIPGSPTKLMLSPGMSTVPRKRAAPSPVTTPKARRIQGSPARKLFVDPPETPVYVLDAFHRLQLMIRSAPSSSSARTLAPSPPILASPRVEKQVNLHDPGFIILQDASSPPCSPTLKRRSSHQEPTTPTDNSPSSIENDQENVPPTQVDTYVHFPSPSVHLSSPSTIKTVRKRSKLAIPDSPEVDDDDDDGGEGGDELTPGRTLVESKAEREARRRRLLVEL